MVSRKDLGAIIDAQPFFQGMPDDLRALLVGCARNERFAAGDLMFREGQPADRFFLLREGSANVEIAMPGRPAVVLETILDGEVLGWSWMVPPHRWTFSARAHTDVRALSFDAPCLTRKMTEDKELGFEVMRRFVPVMAHRLAAARLQMLDLYAAEPVPFVPVAVEKAQPKSKGKNRKADAKLKKKAS